MENEFLPLLYQYGVGLIIFLFGLTIGITDKQLRKSRGFISLLFIFIAGFILLFVIQGFFQIFAPLIGKP